jgi:hypothetical protein
MGYRPSIKSIVQNILESEGASVGGGSSVTPSDINGNIKVNGEETKVYDETGLKDRIEDLEARPTGEGGSTVQASGTNGNVLIDGVETKVYDDTSVKSLISEKANTTHTHTLGDVTGLTEALNGKAAVDHTHADLDERITTLEGAPAATPFDDSAIQTELSEHNSRLTDLEDLGDRGITTYATLADVQATGENQFVHTEDTHKLYVSELQGQSTTDIMPALTSNSQDGYVVGAYSDEAMTVANVDTGAPGAVYKAFADNAPSSAHADAFLSQTLPLYFYIKVPTAKTVGQLSLRASGTDDSCSPNTFRFEYKDADGIWQVAGNYDLGHAVWGDMEQKTFDLPTQVNATEFRLVVTSVESVSKGRVIVDEIQLLPGAVYNFIEVSGSGGSVGTSDGLTQTEADALYEPKIATKGTAFNKNFGTAAGTVSEGNHTHAELHTHSNKTVLDGLSTDGNGKLLLNGTAVDTQGVKNYANSSLLPETAPHGTLVTANASDIYVYDSTADPVKVEKSPTMTANADPASGFTAYSNSENTGTESYKAFDNSTTTFFAPAANTGSGMKYVGLTFGGNVLTIDSCDVLAYGADSAGYNAKNWSISILNESDVWVTVYSNTAETWTSGAYKTFSWTPVKAKDIRFNVTATHLSSYKPYFKDINVYGTTAGKWIKIGAKEVSTQTIAAAGNVSISTTKSNPVVSIQVATATAGEYRNVKDSDLIDVTMTSGSVKITNNGSASATLRVIIS